MNERWQHSNWHHSIVFSVLVGRTSDISYNSIPHTTTKHMYRQFRMNKNWAYHSVGHLQKIGMKKYNRRVVINPIITTTLWNLAWKPLLISITRWHCFLTINKPQCMITSVFLIFFVCFFFVRSSVVVGFLFQCSHPRQNGRVNERMLCTFICSMSCLYPKCHLFSVYMCCLSASNDTTNAVKQ